MMLSGQPDVTAAVLSHSFTMWLTLMARTPVTIWQHSRALNGTQLRCPGSWSVALLLEETTSRLGKETKGKSSWFGKTTFTPWRLWVRVQIFAQVVILWRSSRWRSHFSSRVKVRCCLPGWRLSSLCMLPGCLSFSRNSETEQVTFCYKGGGHMWEPAEAACPLAPGRGHTHTV